MTTPVSSRIHVAPTTQRTAEPSRFDAALRGAVAGAAAGLARGVELAAPIVPGGGVLAGAVRVAAQSVTHASGPAAAAAASGGDDLMEATRALQQDSQTFNLQYLQLQENLQRESREFTALTNVMKVKHDSAKSAINNIH
jgi:hypothetical protein